MRSIDTQFGKVLNEIRLALSSKYPIIYIPTEQKELIAEVVNKLDNTFNVLLNYEFDNSIVQSQDDKENRELVTVLQFPNYNNKKKPSSQKKYEKIGKYVNAHYDPFYDNNKKESSSHEQNDINCPWLFVYTKNKFDENLIKYLSDFLYCINYDSISETTPKTTYFDPYRQDILRKSYVIVNTTAEEAVPPELIPYVYIVRIPPLSDDEIKQHIECNLDSLCVDPSNIPNFQTILEKIVVEMRGFSSYKISRVIHQIIHQGFISESPAYMEEDVLNVIRKNKRELLNSVAGLKWESTEDDIIASGLENVTEWLKEYEHIFADIKKAERNFEDIPKGIIISGFPGSGTSMMAKSAAKIFKKPLISLDMGAMRSSMHGETENNMIRALKIAEDMSPCILWIDEIEKAFSGTSKDSREGDSGTGRRIFGIFLTWLQEKSNACFVFATANDISKLPPELFRSERFNKKYFSFVPCAEECAEIFSNQIREKINKPYEKLLTKLPPEERRYKPKTIFSKETEQPGFWKEILNKANEKFKQEAENFACYKRGRYSEEQLKKYPHLALKNAYGWSINYDEYKGPDVKIFTGADISSVLKEIKHRLNKKYNKKNIRDTLNKPCKYIKEEVEKIATDVIRNYLSYGETNIKNIVECFINLHVNKFEPASENCIIDLREYNDDSLLYKYDPEKKWGCDYDEIIYKKIVASINHYAPIFDKERENK